MGEISFGVWVPSSVPPSTPLTQPHRGRPGVDRQARGGGIAKDIASFWIVTLLFVAVTLVAQRADRRGPGGVAKAAASTGFLVVAHHAGALDTEHGRAIFVGLVLSWFGDVFLLSKARPWFLAGLVAFLLGHVAYVVGFVLRGVEPITVVAAIALLMIPAGLVWRWLREPAGSMRGPVAAYILVISAMLAAAISTTWLHGGAWLLGGATMFYLSDLFVARERFVTPSYANRLVGLPLYYLGQLALATYAVLPLS